MSVQTKYLLKKELTSKESKKSVYSYYPFGMPMPNRQYSLSSKYRFGFNGQEKDDEVYGAGNLNTAEFWEYDTRIGRRWNTDPRPNISISPYAAFANNPIIFNDPLGDTLQGGQKKQVDVKATKADVAKAKQAKAEREKNRGVLNKLKNTIDNYNSTIADDIGMRLLKAKWWWEDQRADGGFDLSRSRGTGTVTPIRGYGNPDDEKSLLNGDKVDKFLGYFGIGMKTKGAPDAGFEENMPNAADNAKSMMENEMDNSPIKNAYNAVLRVWNQRNVKEKMRSANSQTMSSNKTQKDVKPNTSFYNKADSSKYFKAEDGTLFYENPMRSVEDTVDRLK